MTEEQIMAKYGNVKLSFVGYYKYTFTYIGHAENGDNIVATYGGCGDDIYKADLGATETFIGLYPDSYEICDKDGKQLHVKEQEY